MNPIFCSHAGSIIFRTLNLVCVGVGIAGGVCRIGVSGHRSTIGDEHFGDIFSNLQLTVVGFNGSITRGQPTRSQCVTASRLPSVPTHQRTIQFDGGPCKRYHRYETFLCLVSLKRSHFVHRVDMSQCLQIIRRSFIHSFFLSLSCSYIPLTTIGIQADQTAEMFTYMSCSMCSSGCNPQSARWSRC